MGGVSFLRLRKEEAISTRVTIKHEGCEVDVRVRCKPKRQRVRLSFGPFKTGEVRFTPMSASVTASVGQTFDVTLSTIPAGVPFAATPSITSDNESIVVVGPTTDNGDGTATAQATIVGGNEEDTANINGTDGSFSDSGVVTVGPTSAPGETGVSLSFGTPTGP